MGDRVNFVFDTGQQELVVLYSHYGGSNSKEDLIDALNHSRPRFTDHEYFTRMVISYLIKDAVMAETGFGIYAINRSEITNLNDKIVVIDLLSNKFSNDFGEPVPFYSDLAVV